MNKMLIGVVAIVVVIGGLFFLTKNQNQSSQTPVQQQVQTPTQQVVPTGTQNKVEGNNTVTIQSFTFSPAVLAVKQGTKVTWVNQDSVSHTIKADTFNSENLSQGDKFEFTFDKKGSFDYICGIHPRMTGKIVVE